MTPCTLIALGQLNYFQQQLRKEEEGDQLPLTAAPGSSSSLGHSKEPAVAPGTVAVPARYGSDEHIAVPLGSASGKGYNVVHPEPASAAAAADAAPAPAHLATLASDDMNVVQTGGQAGVVPVADVNGRV
jgi:hypothetical protein